MPLVFNKLLIKNKDSNLLVSLLLILSVVMFPLQAIAKQQSFNKKEQAAHYLFHYQWLDADKTEQEINVALEKDALLNKFRDFRHYKPNMVQRYIDKSLKKKLRKERFRGVTMRFVKDDGQTKVALSGDDPEKVYAARQKITELETASYQDYLSSHYYQKFSFPSGNIGLKPDHVRFAMETAIDLKPFKPIILEKVKIKNIREVTEFTLGFVQSIPYATLASRITSSGAGFNSPLKLLWENQGDCDSKVTLTAALLRSLMPRVKMALVFLEGHALIGIKTRPIGDDITISHNNITYVLAEPTGPAMLKLGKVAESSEQAIYQGQYSIEEFHDQVVNDNDDNEDIN